jgi:hypothetical protein
MPFKSEKQRKWMWANEPEMAEKWTNEEDEIEESVMKITKRQLRRIIKEALDSTFSPELQSTIDQLDSFTVEELGELWRAVAASHRKKEKEIKAGFNKGDKVEFDHDGETITGTVARRGGKFVSVNVHGWNKPWKRNPSSLRKI